jgi:hypothetical protein
MIGEKLFNEIQPHIMFHPFDTQHCVEKTLREWGPSLLVDQASYHRSLSRTLKSKNEFSMIFEKKLTPKFPYGLNPGPVFNPIGSRVFHKFFKKQS